MTLKFKNKKAELEKALASATEAFNTVSANAEATPEEITNALQTLNKAQADLASNEVREDLQAQIDAFNANFDAGKVGMSANEYKFFNEVITEVGYKEEILLPEETINEIFEDLTTEHPVLDAIGIRNAGLRLKFLRSETSGVAVWGKIFGPIKGQLDAAFSEETEIQNKLTAFVVIPKDLEDVGPEWIKGFVKTQIAEAFSVALEEAYVKGTGKDMPVGLDRDVSSGVSVVDGAYPKKTATGTLTFADSKTTVKEITSIFKYHSVKENGAPFKSDGKVILLVNPSDEWDVKTQYTHLNANGVYVTALPYNLRIIATPHVAVGEGISFIAERYDAYVGGGVTVRQFNETLALEDLTLFTAKQFAYGMAKDDKAAALWTLAITEDPETVPEG